MRNNIIKEIENGGSGLTIRHDQQFQKRGKKQKVIWNANTFFDYVMLLDNETEDTLSITPKKLFATLYPEKPFNAEKLFSFFHDAHVPSKNNKAKKKLDQALTTPKNENKEKKVNLPKTPEQKETIDFSTAEKLRGDDFSGLNFSGSQFEKEKFEGRNLCGTNFSNCDLRTPTFDKSSTFDDKTNLQNAKVSEDLVSLLDSQNQQKILRGSDISDIDFSKNGNLKINRNHSFDFTGCTITKKTKFKDLNSKKITWRDDKEFTYKVGDYSISRKPDTFMAEFTRIYYLYCENDRRSFFGHKLGWLGEILKNDKLSDGQRLLIVLQRIENNPDSRTDKAFQQAVYSLFFQEEKNKLTGENPALSDDQKKKLEKVQTALTLSVKAVDGIIADQNIIAGRQIHHDIQKGRSDFSNKKIVGNVSDVSKKTIINFTNADLTQATIDVSILKNANLTGAKLTAKQLIAVFEKATLAESKKLNDYKIDFLETFVEPNDIPVLCKLINARKLIMPLIKALDGKRYIVLDASKNVTVADLKAYISDLKSLDVVKTYLGEVVLPKINDPEYGVDNLPLDNLPLDKDKEHSQNKDTTYTIRECWAFMGRSEAPSLNGVKITGSAMAMPEEELFLTAKKIKLENHVDFTGADLSMVDFKGEYGFLARIVAKYPDVKTSPKQKEEIDKRIVDFSKLSNSSFFKNKELPFALSQIIVTGKAVSELTFNGKTQKIEDILDFSHADLSKADFHEQSDLLSRIVKKYTSVKRSWEQVVATEKNCRVGFSYLEETCCEEKKLPLSLNGMIIFGKPSDEFYVYGKPRKIEDVLDFEGADLSKVDFRGKYDLLARITQKYKVTVTQSQLDEAEEFLPSGVQYEAVKEVDNNQERLKSPTRSQSSMFGKIEKSTDNNNADWDYTPKNQ